MPTRLIATQPLVYAERSLKTGDVFEATDEHAHLLKLIKRAADAPIERPGWLQTRVLEPEPEPQGFTPVVPRVKRRYRRRDMRVEP